MRFACNLIRSTTLFLTLLLTRDSFYLRPTVIFAEGLRRKNDFDVPVLKYPQQEADQTLLTLSSQSLFSSAPELSDCY